MEPGESLEDTARREVLEETGIHFQTLPQKNYKVNSKQMASKHWMSVFSVKRIA